MASLFEDFYVFGYNISQKGGTMVSLGKEIKKARIDKDLNQLDVQKMTGISQKHLSAIENDNVDPRWSMMKRLARVLDLDLAQLAREDTADV